MTRLNKYKSKLKVTWSENYPGRALCQSGVAVPT